MHGTHMGTAIHIILVVGFLAVDFLLFHDALKPGEIISPVEWLVGGLSLLLFASSSAALVKTRIERRLA
jgi:hypothetical protein